VAKLLIDTNVLIDALRGESKSTAYFKRISEEELNCSAITLAELWAGVRMHEETALENFLQNFRAIPTDAAVARQAGAYMRQFAKSHHLNLPDALIAASVRLHHLELITRNTKHFPMKDISITTPY